MRVGIFDSGIGGLTVLKELQQKYPNNEYFYYGDTLNVPYGNKKAEDLLLFSSEIIDYFHQKEVELIIIACGTIASNLYKKLRQITDIPLYNIVDMTIDYINQSHYQDVLVLATPNTITSDEFKNKLKMNVHSIACPELAFLIESGADTKKALQEYLKDLPKVDTIVLGCTHYPLIKENIKEIIGNKIDILDMGKILSNTITLGDHKKSLDLYFSKQVEKDIIKQILNT